MSTIPLYIEDLVACLDEQGIDDNTIIGICCSILAGSQCSHKASSLIAFLQKSNRTKEQILSFYDKLEGNN